MSTQRRQRLTPDESRSRAIDAARRLLIEGGPRQVTLKAVAGQIGQTHANLLHHFGSAAGLQAALVEDTARQLVKNIGDAVYRRRAGEIGINELIATIFDCFDSGGAGRLATWMILTGDKTALDPVFCAIHDLVNELTVAAPTDRVRDISLAVMLMAIGDTLLGSPVSEALGLPRQRARALASRQLADLAGLPRPGVDV